jgi:CMP/dCMP kinase
MTAPVIVAIDGPAGVGKSTVARLLAERLGLPVLDTGAMYRAAALRASELAIDPADGVAVARLASELELEVRRAGTTGIEVWLEGQPVGERIRTPEISAATSVISTHAPLRRRLVELQRRAAAREGAVVEGRDIGSVVFPETPFKFFLTARPAVRAQRRFVELQAKGLAVDLEKLQAELSERDARDGNRADSPMRADESYIVVDSSDAPPAEIVEEMVAAIAALSKAAHAV